jgi:hypothetical protein
MPWHAGRLCLCVCVGDGVVYQQVLRQHWIRLKPNLVVFVCAMLSLAATCMSDCDKPYCAVCHLQYWWRACLFVPSSSICTSSVLDKAACALLALRSRGIVYLCMPLTTPFTLAYISVVAPAAIACCLWADGNSQPLGTEVLPHHTAPRNV